jgi:SNF2 family DNA or RNA helicase
MDRAEGMAGYAWWLDMGLGKTPLSLNDIVDRMHRDEIDVAIVVCPNSLKSNWVDEASKWGFVPPVVKWPDVPKPNAANYVFVVNYEMFLYGSSYDVVYKILSTRRCAFYLDEADRIKNPQGKISKLILGLKNESVSRRELTGTPMTQGVMDLHPQLAFIGATRMNPYAFRNRFAQMGGYLGKKVVGTKNEEELQEILDKYTFRATKDEWLDLPEKIFPSPIDVEMKGDQLKAYRSMEQDFVVLMSELQKSDQFDPEDEVSVNMVVTQLLKLQQIACGFVMDETGKVVELVEPSKNPRIAAVREFIDSAPGKSIIFCKHKHSARMLLDQLSDFGCSRLVGGMSDEEVSDEKSKFNCHGGNRIMVAQLSVGGIGHTLLGESGPDRCSTTAFFENDFSLRNRMQAEDRNHRGAQDRAVVYGDFVSSSIDRKVIHALQSKLNVVKRIIDRC